MLERELNRLMKKKVRMIVILLILLFSCYFTLPFALAWMPNIMNRPTILGFSWIWMYTFLLIPLTWMLGWVYYRFAKKMDHQIESLQQQEGMR